MNPRVLAPSLIAVVACLAGTATQGVQAQNLKLSPQISAPPGAESLTRRPADFIVAVVNSEPITNNEVRQEVLRLRQQLAQQRVAQPSPIKLLQQVRDRLINDKAQLQLARETGVRVDDAALDEAELGVARQNQVNVIELRRRLTLDGTSVTQFREQLRDQMLITRLREREVDARVRVTDAEVAQFLSEQQNATDAASQNINIAQILVAVPDDANSAQLALLQAKADGALVRARAGDDFAKLVLELSDATDKATGGQLGLRSADRYPPLFVEAVQALAVGGLSNVIRSDAGFHVLKLVEKQAPGMSIVQSRARHILLRPSAQLTETVARDKLRDFKARLESGKSDFTALARDNSQDGSAAQGGDLGWANPGQFVPEFEDAMNTLAPGQISEPLVSRFGMHLIQLQERRNVVLGPREQNEAVRALLRDKKLDEAYANWAQDVRGRAYVELREPPE